MNTNTLLSSRVMIKEKRKEETGIVNVKSKVIGGDLSCEIKPMLQFIDCNLVQYFRLNDNVCTLIMIENLGYTSVDKSLRHCEHFDTSTYLQDHLQFQTIPNERRNCERRKMWLKFS